MPRVEPKKTFLTNKPLAGWLESIVDSDNWQATASFALAEYASRRPSAEELRGAVAFVDLLSTFSDAKSPDRKDPGFNLKRPPNPNLNQQEET